MKRDTLSYHGYRFPPDIISRAVWLYHRFGVSFRDVEDLLAQRGITVSYEAIRLRTDTRTIAPKSPTSPHGNASDKCAGSNLPGRHNDSCPCMDSSATSSALAVTWCERCIIGSYEDALFSFGMQSRSPPDSN